MGGSVAHGVPGGPGWQLRSEDVAAGGHDVALSATAAQCAALCDALDLVRCRELRSPVRLRRRAVADFISADNCTAGSRSGAWSRSRTCGGQIEAPVDVLFLPAVAISRGDDRPGGQDGPDIAAMSDDGVLDIGQQIYETLAVSLDPFPRKHGVRSDPSGPQHEHSGDPAASGPAGGDHGPFAVLRTLKDNN